MPFRTVRCRPAGFGEESSLVANDGGESDRPDSFVPSAMGFGGIELKNLVS